MTCNRLIKQIASIFAAAFIFQAGSAFACTGIKFSVSMPEPGYPPQTFAGRTMEFGPDVAYWKVLYTPKDYNYESCKISLMDMSFLDACVREIDPKSDKKRYESVKGYSWPVRYSYVGFAPMKHLAKKGIGKRIEFTAIEISDGINDQGLYSGAFYHMGFAQYSNAPANLAGQKNISNGDFIAWVLGQFSTVDEVKAALADVEVRLFDIELFEQALQPDNMPHLHYHVVDRSGKAIVVEFVDGKPKVFDSVGVITNAPNYDWQVMNLRNYVGLQTKNHENTTFMGTQYNKLSNGTGGIGLPGDFSSTSRFIRAMYFLNATVTNIKMKTADEAIQRSFRILNQFDIPEGSVVETKPNNPDKVSTMEATSWTSMADLQTLRYYYNTMQSRVIRMVDLNQLKKLQVTKPVAIELPANELVIDETPLFKK